MYLPVNQTIKQWFEQYAWEVLQHSPHVVPLKKYFAARLTNFPHTLEMDYCVKGSDVLNSQWDECLNRGHEYVKMLCACPMYLCINKLCQQYYVQYSFQPYFQNILCTVYISNNLNRRYGFSDSRSCRPRINTLMNLTLLCLCYFSFSGLNKG